MCEMRIVSLLIPRLVLLESRRRGDRVFGTLVDGTWNVPTTLVDGTWNVPTTLTFCWPQYLYLFRFGAVNPFVDRQTRENERRFPSIRFEHCLVVQLAP
jgi:hypothetical protein